MRRLSLLAAVLLSAACAREAPPRVANAPPPPATCPVVWSGGAPVFSEPAPVMPVFDNSLGIASEPPPPTAGITSSPMQPASAWQPVTLASRDIPAGDRCLSMLDATGTTYKKLSQKHGIETPIEVTSDIGGVRYEPAAGQTLLCDCRFAVALHRVAPVLKSVGVSRVRFSGAYSYRMSRVGRLSLHAYGLALDVHELVVNGSLLSVRRDFTRGLGNGCASDSPALNQVACRLKSSAMFRELLTPDSNADHWDHFHLGVEPLTNSPVGTVVAKPKKPAAKPVAKAPPNPAPVEAAPGEPAFVPDEEPALDFDRPDEEPQVVLDTPKRERRETRRGEKRVTRKEEKNRKTRRDEDRRERDASATDEPRYEKDSTNSHKGRKRAAADAENVRKKHKAPRDERDSESSKQERESHGGERAKGKTTRDESKHEKKRDEPQAKKTKNRRSAGAQRTGST